MLDAIKNIFKKEEQDELEGTIIALARKRHFGKNSRLIEDIGTIRKTQKSSGLINKTIYYVEWRNLRDNKIANSWEMDKQRMIDWLSDTETYINLGHGDEQKKLLALMLTKPEYFEK